VELIAAERVRQFREEGWTAEHDALEHSLGSLARAAMCYTCHPREGERLYVDVRYADGRPPESWPWDPSWWKPSPDDRVRELVKAGALIAAEIDRLIAAEVTDG
jgi:hypothetical protein